jgi:imidazolonepropionase-like amidohydrolase
VDGEPPSWPGTAVVTSPAAARAEVRRQATEGWDFIKVYNRLRPDVYDAVLAEAGEAGIPVIGHVPLAADIERASAGGQASVEHLTGIAEAVADGRGPAGWLRLDEDAAATVAQRLAERGVWVCPTLTILAHLADRNLSPSDAGRAREHQARMVAALYDAGVPLLAGTDAGIDVVPAGSTLAVELELLVEAGLSPFAALRTATSEAARFLGIGDVSGTVEVGRRADLALLTANPLEDIRAVREPVGLVQRGRILFRPEAPAAR